MLSVAYGFDDNVRLRKELQRLLLNGSFVEDQLGWYFQMTFTVIIV